MEYRTFGRTGLEVSALSIGAMRLPKDDDEAVTLLRTALDAGCNYIDTSRGYGDSEIKVGKALKDGYREKAILSTKCSPWILTEEGYTASADCTRAKIDDSMQRLDVDRLDFYQVWNIDSAETFELARAKGNMVDGIRKAMDEGIIDHIAATTHAPENVVFDMIDSGLFETITVTYHLLDRAREAVMTRACEKGIGVVVMNPMGGGALGADSPVIRDFLPESDLASKTLALKFVLDNPHVTTAISGISKLSDVHENLAALDLPSLTAPQRYELACRAGVIEAKGKAFCTQCGYCSKACEADINIPHIFSLVNRAKLYDMHEWARASYARMKAERRADHCTACALCEPKCTNNLSIPHELAKAHEFLTS